MKSYWLATRPYSLTASVVPVLLGAALAKYLLPGLLLGGAFWLRFGLVLLGCLAIQIVSNLVNDLVDFKTGLDTAESGHKFKALVNGALSWRQMLGFTLLMAALSGVIGIYFIWLVRGPLLWIVVGGGVLAVEYTAPPLKLKYRALGDLGVLLCFGLGMLFGTYVVLGSGAANSLSSENVATVLLYALPSASLVVAILHANNHRDRAADELASAHTLANKLPARASKSLLLALLVGPYFFAAAASVFGALVFGPIALCGLLVFLTLPSLLTLLPPIRADHYEATVPGVARLHGQFGVALTLAVVGQTFLSHGRSPGA
ncbi:MAG: prenyltransferase [Fimbriimonadaceae bacterium]